MDETLTLEDIVNIYYDSDNIGVLDAYNEFKKIINPGFENPESVPLDFEFAAFKLFEMELIKHSFTAAGDRSESMRSVEGILGESGVSDFLEWHIDDLRRKYTSEMDQSTIDEHFDTVSHYHRVLEASGDPMGVCNSLHEQYGDDLSSISENVFQNEGSKHSRK